MNCKIGDLAIIVRLDKANPHTLGMLVDVIGPPTRGLHGWWLIRPAGGGTLQLNGHIFTECDCHDNALRPIRDSDNSDVLESRELESV